MVNNELNDQRLPNKIKENQERLPGVNTPKGEHEPITEKSEQQASEQETARERPIDSKKSFALPSLRRPKKIVPPTQDEVTLKIEHVLEDGLSDSYRRLSPIAQQEFNIKGEETAAKIREMLNSTHVKVKKVLALILEWLKLLPGINRFFLEQEAKIKADRILQIIDKKRD